MIQIFAIHQDGYREEITTNLYWFEENFVKDWRGEGNGERFTFEVFVDGVLVWKSEKAAEITGTTKSKRKIDRYITAMQKDEPIVINGKSYIVLSVDHTPIEKGPYSYEVVLRAVTE